MGGSSAVHKRSKNNTFVSCDASVKQSDINEDKDKALALSVVDPGLIPSTPVWSL